MFGFYTNIMLILSNPITDNKYKNFLKPYRQIFPAFGAKTNAQDPLQMKGPLAHDSVELSSKKDLLSHSPAEIKDAVCRSLRDNRNYLGGGFEGRVFKIENTDYCIKIPYESKNLKKSDISFSLREKDRLNQVVAKFSNGAFLMKYVEGIPVSEKLDKSESDINKMLLKLPAGAFQGLFRQICQAQDKGLLFDCNPANVIINPKKKTLTAIDFYEMDPRYPEEIRPLRCMLEALAGDDSFDVKQKCALKIISGALKELESGVKPCLSLGDFKFRNFMEKVFNGSKPDSFDEWEKLNACLTDVLCLKLREICGEDVKDSLEYKIEEAKSIIDVLSSCV